MTGRTTDDELLERLGHALAPEARQPPESSVAAVRAQAEAAALPPPTPLPARSKRWRQPVTWVAAAAVAAASFAAGVLLADDLPRPVRGAAHAIGLPVESNDLVDARAALDRLGLALAVGDAEAAREADAEMVRLVQALNADERAKVEPVAHEVHLRALELIGG